MDGEATPGEGLQAAGRAREDGEGAVRWVRGELPVVFDGTALTEIVFNGEVVRGLRYNGVSVYGA